MYNQPCVAYYCRLCTTLRRPDIILHVLMFYFTNTEIQEQEIQEDEIMERELLNALETLLARQHHE